MAEFVAFDDRVEVNGQTILSFTKGMAGFEDTAYIILRRNGIENVAIDAWYPQQAWLDGFKEISNKIGDNTLKSIGTNITNSAIWPIGIDSIEKALASIDIAYHMNHRINGKVLFDSATGILTEGIGHYFFEKVKDNEFKITCENPYPCEFDKGIIKSAIEKFKKPGQKAEFLKNLQAGCRKKGANSCTYHINIS